MKIKFVSAFATAIVLLFSSCDFVTVPDQELLSGGPGSNDTTVTIDSVRKVLLEDYTGHKCPNCPSAAATAASIAAANGDDVIVIGVHAGFFANPMASGTQFLRDFRTTAGTAYDGFFGISAIGNPNGMINRKDYTSSTVVHVKNPGTWSTEVAAELTKPATAGVEIENTYNSSTRVLNCSVNSMFFYDTLTGGPYKLVVMMIQNSIISDQQDGSTYVPSYIHEHVLRANINGTWGDNLLTGAIVAGDLISKS